MAPGQSASLTVLRGNDQKQFSLKVATRPEDEGAVGRGDAPEAEAEAKDAAPGLGLAISPLTPELQGKLGLEGDEGVVVTNVAPNGPAERAGLRRGDLVLEVNRQPVRRPEDVRAVLGKLKENDLVLLRVRRGDQSSFLTLRLGAK